jgi:hypothetical protein
MMPSLISPERQARTQRLRLRHTGHSNVEGVDMRPQQGEDAGLRLQSYLSCPRQAPPSTADRPPHRESRDVSQLED